MYQRFKRSLLMPSELSMYLKDSWIKVWVYFFLLLILSSLPFIMVDFSSNGLSDNDKLLIKDYYTSHLSSAHKIEDGKLIIDSNSLNQAIYLRFDVYTIGIVNTPSSPEYQGIRMIFIEDGIRLTTFGRVVEIYSYETLNLDNFDFSDYSSQNIDRLIKAIDQMVMDHHVVSKTFKILVTVISTFIELIFFVLIGAVFSRHVLPFKYKFKMAVYVLTVYVVLSLFALFLNNGLFIFLGIILMMIYMRKAFSRLTMV